MDGEITSAELEALLEAEETPVIVDIRHSYEFQQSHIPGSDNIPFAELPSEIETVRGADRVVTVCPHGKASVQAARLIASFEGFDGTVESLECGLVGWEGQLESETQTVQEGDDTREAPF